MYHAPFHRRILPWLYVAIFLGVAPILIFYTAGYRYNSKKHQIERSGTLIVNTSPKGTRVFLDGHDTQEVSPITFQNITPGWHELRIEKSGYHTWQRTLNVRAEQVTFATDVWLWRQADPSLLYNGTIRALRTDPTGQQMAIISSEATSSVFNIWTQDSGWQSHDILPNLSPTSSAPLALQWRDDGQALVINGLDPLDTSWWVQSRNNEAASDILPSGIYHWSQQELVGSNESRSFRLDPDRHTFMRDILPTSTLSADRNVSIQSVSSSINLRLSYEGFQTHVFALPYGDWRIAGFKQAYTLLKDKQRWLALEPALKRPFLSQVYGDYPRWLPEAILPRALFIHGYELWDWTLDHQPVLLWRQSEPLVQAAWHRNGTTVFIATDRQVMALNTSPTQDRANVVLAQFDHIQDMDVFGKNLMVAGTKDGKEGLWSLPIE